MRIIEAIKKFWKNFGVTYSNESMEPRLFLRRGPMAIIKTIKPHYIGELVLCTDEPYLAVGRIYDYVLIPIPEEARTEFLAHYNHAKNHQLSWE